MNELELKNKTYRIDRLDALTQFHLVRKLTPVLAAAGISIKALVKSGESLDGGLDGLLPVIEPVSKIMAKMDTEDVNFILFSCLTKVARKQDDGRYQSVIVGDASSVSAVGMRFMFEDIDMMIMIRLTIEVLRVNLGPFFEELGVAMPLASS